jgi:hypothetical protein
MFAFPLFVLAFAFAFDGTPSRRRLTSYDGGYWDLHARMTEWIMIGMPVELAEFIVLLSEQPVPVRPDGRVEALLRDVPGSEIVIHPRGGFQVRWRGWIVEVEPFAPTPDPVFRDRLEAYRSEVESRPLPEGVVLRTADVWSSSLDPAFDCVRVRGLGLSDAATETLSDTTRLRLR